MKRIAVIELWDEEAPGFRPLFRLVLSTPSLLKPLEARNVDTIGTALDMAARYVCSDIYNRDTAQDLLPVMIEVEVEEPVPA